MPKPFKGRDLGLETAWNLANVGSQFDAAIALGRGAGLIDRLRSGLSRLIPIILGEVHDFAGDLRAILRCASLPRLLRLIIGS